MLYCLVLWLLSVNGCLYDYHIFSFFFVSLGHFLFWDLYLNNLNLSLFVGSLISVFYTLSSLSFSSISDSLFHHTNGGFFFLLLRKFWKLYFLLHVVCSLLGKYTPRLLSLPSLLTVIKFVHVSFSPFSLHLCSIGLWFLCTICYERRGVSFGFFTYYFFLQYAFLPFSTKIFFSKGKVYFLYFFCIIRVCYFSFCL